MKEEQALEEDKKLEATDIAKELELIETKKRLQLAAASETASIHKTYRIYRDDQIPIACLQEIKPYPPIIPDNVRIPKSSED